MLSFFPERKLLIFDRLGMLAETVDRMDDFSKMTPASTRNSFADGSRFSRLDEYGCWLKLLDGHWLDPAYSRLSKISQNYPFK